MEKKRCKRQHVREKLRLASACKIIQEGGGAPARSAADCVRAAVHVDDLSRRGREPVGQQRHAGARGRLGVGEVPAKRCPLGPRVGEPVEPGDAPGGDGLERVRDPEDPFIETVWWSIRNCCITEPKSP
jgi:hypothetical protein